VKQKNGLSVHPALGLSTGNDPESEGQCPTGSDFLARPQEVTRRIRSSSRRGWQISDFSRKAIPKADAWIVADPDMGSGKDPGKIHTDRQITVELQAMNAKCLPGIRVSVK
jgi:hypothetical protein